MVSLNSLREFKIAIRGPFCSPEDIKRQEEAVFPKSPYKAEKVMTLPLFWGDQEHHKHGTIQSLEGCHRVLLFQTLHSRPISGDKDLGIWDYVLLLEFGRWKLVDSLASSIESGWWISLVSFCSGLKFPFQNFLEHLWETTGKNLWGLSCSLEGTHCYPSHNHEFGLGKSLGQSWLCSGCLEASGTWLICGVVYVTA